MTSAFRNFPQTAIDTLVVTICVFTVGHFYFTLCLYSVSK